MPASRKAANTWKGGPPAAKVFRQCLHSVSLQIPFWFLAMHLFLLEYQYWAETSSRVSPHNPQHCGAGLVLDCGLTAQPGTRVPLHAEVSVVKRCWRKDAGPGGAAGSQPTSVSMGSVESGRFWCGLPASGQHDNDRKNCTKTSVMAWSFSDLGNSLCGQ